MQQHLIFAMVQDYQELKNQYESAIARVEEIQIKLKKHVLQQLELQDQEQVQHLFIEKNKIYFQQNFSHSFWREQRFCFFVNPEAGKSLVEQVDKRESQETQGTMADLSDRLNTQIASLGNWHETFFKTLEDAVDPSKRSLLQQEKIKTEQEVNTLLRRMKETLPEVVTEHEYAEMVMDLTKTKNIGEISEKTGLKYLGVFKTAYENWLSEGDKKSWEQEKVRGSGFVLDFAVLQDVAKLSDKSEQAYPQISNFLQRQGKFFMEHFQSFPNVGRQKPQDAVKILKDLKKLPDNALVNAWHFEEILKQMPNSECSRELIERVGKKLLQENEEAVASLLHYQGGVFFDAEFSVDEQLVVLEGIMTKETTDWKNISLLTNVLPRFVGEQVMVSYAKKWVNESNGVLQQKGALLALAFGVTTNKLSDKERSVISESLYETSRTSEKVAHLVNHPSLLQYSHNLPIATYISMVTDIVQDTGESQVSDNFVKEMAKKRGILESQWNEPVMQGTHLIVLHDSTDPDVYRLRTEGENNFSADPYIALAQKSGMKVIPVDSKGNDNAQIMVNKALSQLPQGAEASIYIGGHGQSENSGRQSYEKGTIKIAEGRGEESYLNISSFFQQLKNTSSAKFQKVFMNACYSGINAKQNIHLLPDGVEVVTSTDGGDVEGSRVSSDAWGYFAFDAMENSKQVPTNGDMQRILAGRLMALGKQGENNNPRIFIARKGGGYDSV